VNQPIRSTNQSANGSARDWDRASPRDPATEERARLLAAFHASATDLAANRAGCLSGAQIQRLRRAARRTLLGALAGDVVLLAIMVAVASKPLKPVQVILALLLGGALLAVGVVGFRHLGRSATDGVVERLTGEARISNRGRGGTFLVIVGREFRVPRRSYNLRGGANYSVYFTPAGKAVVALEPATE
jgi:hypothetical protein